jgi:hypothetical protein
MEQNRNASSRLPAWSRTRQWLMGLPFKAQIVLTIFLVAAIVLAVHTWRSSNDASLHLRLQHGFRSGQLTVLIDGHRAYSGKLTGYSKKKYGLFGENVEGSLSQVFPVSSGAHQILVRVEPGDGTVQEDVISGQFSSQTERDLAVTAQRNGLKMSWKGESVPEVARESSPVPSDSQPSWLSRYAGSLLLTAAGSIISAMTGLAFKELPGYLRSRQEPTTPSNGVGTQS